MSDDGGTETTSTETSTAGETAPPTEGGSATAPVGEGDSGGDGGAPEGGGERYAIVVDGVEEQLTLDEIRTLAQKGKAADKRFQEAAQLRRELEERGKQFDTVAKRLDEDALLRAYLDDNQDEFYELLAQRLEYDQLPPEERAKVDERRELERKAKLHDQTQKEREQEQAAAEVAQYRQRFAAAADQSLAAAGITRDHPEYAYAVERWASEVGAQWEAGNTAYTAEEAAQTVAEKIGSVKASAVAELTGLEEDDLLKRLDEAGLMAKIRAADAKRLERRPGQRPPPSKGNGRPSASDTGDRVLSTRDIIRLSKGLLPKPRRG